MKRKTYYIKEIVNQEFSAGSKARNDIDEIVKELDYEMIEVVPCRQINNIKDVFNSRKLLINNWRTIINSVTTNSNLVMQYPLGAYFGSYTINKKRIQYLKKKGIKVIGLIHDIVHLQEPLLVRKSTEMSLLKQYDALICHNNVMKEKLVKSGIDPNKLVVLEIFDYLADNSETRVRTYDEGITIAGNLMKRKAGYLYKLMGTTKLHLYGPNFSGEEDKLTTYHGSLDPSELIKVVEGSYNLIWDGPDLSGCNGPYGKYQKINNPHRVSMALAAKMPIIINSKAALSSFVNKYKIGLVVNSLEDIDNVICDVRKIQYQEMIANLEEISQKVRSGYFTKAALQKAEELVNND